MNGKYFFPQNLVIWNFEMGFIKPYNPVPIISDSKTVGYPELPDCTLGGK